MRYIGLPCRVSETYLLVRVEKGMITVEGVWQLQKLPILVSQLSRGTFKTCCLGQLLKPNARRHTHNIDVNILCS